MPTALSRHRIVLLGGFLVELRRPGSAPYPRAGHAVGLSRTQYTACQIQAESAKKETYQTANASERESRGRWGPAEVWPRNWLAPVILLSLRECTSYGYKLIEQAAVFGFGAINPGTLYRTLRQTEQDGFCEPSWDTTNGGGPARRVYSITGAGEAYLDFWVRSLEQYERNLDAFFQLYTGRPVRRDQKKGDG
jgi:poly-beta-hydroxybutyrate-responsive repressor